jgi:probable F420-dependent oxidoreductase
MPDVKLGALCWNQYTDWPSLLEAGRRADRLGFDSLWTWDHVYPIVGSHEGPMFEGWLTLTAWAGVTEQTRIGLMVGANTFREPTLTAKMATTLDHISGGRAILGIGAGWFKRDYDEYGYEFGEARDRLRDLREALPRIKERLGKVNPPPVGRLPILIGGSGPKVTLKLVAQHAQMWHSFGDADDYRRKNEILLEHCAAEGRDPAEIERTWAVSSVADAEALAAVGVQHFITDVGGDGEGYDLSLVRELVRWRDSVS